MRSADKLCLNVCRRKRRLPFLSPRPASQLHSCAGFWIFHLSICALIKLHITFILRQRSPWEPPFAYPSATENKQLKLLTLRPGLLCHSFTPRADPLKPSHTHTRLGPCPVWLSALAMLAPAVERRRLAPCLAAPQHRPGVSLVNRSSSRHNSRTRPGPASLVRQPLPRAIIAIVCSDPHNLSSRTMVPVSLVSPSSKTLAQASLDSPSSNNNKMLAPVYLVSHSSKGSSKGNSRSNSQIWGTASLEPHYSLRPS